MRMRGIFKIGIILAVLLLSTQLAVAAGLNIDVSPETVTQGDQIIVNVTQDGTPQENVFLQFTINDGTPIYAETNATGCAVFKPVIAGTLKVVATKDNGVNTSKASRSITVNQVPSGDEGGDGGDATPPSVHIDVDYRYIGDIYSGDISFVSGMTVLDALDNASKKGGFSYNTKEESWGTYTYKIAGIEEKSEGPTSGWMYWVNGAAPPVGCADKTLQNRDRVIWYWSASMNSVPPTEYPPTGSSGGTGSGSALTSSQTTTPEIIEETKKIESIEAGENTSVTFEKIDIARIIINANNTIHDAEVTIQQIEKRPENITNISGMPYRYFNITTTNLTATNITNAIIKFKVNKTWINESNIDETTITLNRYSDINNNWSALPTSKIKEDNTSLYFEAETPSFSLFVISGEEKTVSMATTEAPTAETTAIPVPLPKVTPVSSTPTPVPLSTHIHGSPGSLILIVIAVIVIGGIIIVVVLKRKK